MTVKEMCSCGCGAVGNVFVSLGEFYWGHFCKNTGHFYLKRLPGLDWMKIYKEIHFKEEGLGEP